MITSYTSSDQKYPRKRVMQFKMAAYHLLFVFATLALVATTSCLSISRLDEDDFETIQTARSLSGKVEVAKPSQPGPVESKKVENPSVAKEKSAAPKASEKVAPDSKTKPVSKDSLAENKPAGKEADVLARKGEPHEELFKKLTVGTAEKILKLDDDVIDEKFDLDPIEAKLFKFLQFEKLNELLDKKGKLIDDVLELLKKSIREESK